LCFGEKAMLIATEFVIYKSESKYSITEFGESGVKRVFVKDGCVKGDGEVLYRLCQMKPERVTIEKYLERNAGFLISEDRVKKAG
jgi:hypothetical protein